MYTIHSSPYFSGREGLYIGMGYVGGAYVCSVISMVYTCTYVCVLGKGVRDIKGGECGVCVRAHLCVNVSVCA